MKLRRLTISLAVLTLALPFALFGQKIGQLQTTVSSDAHAYVSPWQKLEARAKLENPSDANSVRALMDEIFNFPRSFGPIPPEMQELVEQRLVQAEMSYKFGRRPGIQEADLVKLFDKLAEKLNLPDYARTTPHQIEVLRFGMENTMPVFMGPAMPEHSSATATPGSGELSPAQATHILFVLAEQKMFNPDYQLAPEKWEQTQYKPAMDKLLKYKELRDSGQLQTVKNGEFRVSVMNSQDLRRILSQRISDMSITDGLDIVEEVFKMEGI
jgi:hypothetical protein